MESARAKGLTVTADQYPYTASSTSLEATLLPAWCREGGRKNLEKRLADPIERAKIRDAVSKQLQSAQRIQIASYAKNRAWAGKSLDEIAKQLGKEVVDVVMEIESNGGAGGRELWNERRRRSHGDVIAVGRNGQRWWSEDTIFRSTSSSQLWDFQ